MLYVIGALVLAVFVGILVIAIKKENAMQKQMLEELNHAQIEELKENEVTDFDDKKFTWIQKGIIGNVNDKGAKVALKVLWYNTVIDNNTLNDFQYADIKIKKDEYESRKLSKGIFVNIFIDPQKANAKIV